MTEYYLGWKEGSEKSYWIPPCDIEGTIPVDLHGTFLRNGPGLDEIYGKQLKHPIDGDGFVCGLTFWNGSVHFKSKFVQTSHRTEEEKQKKFLYAGQMGTRNSSIAKDTIKTCIAIISGGLPKVIFRNPSNTNVFYWGGKVLSCYETHLPYCLDPQTLNTLGDDDLGGALKLGAMAAHFRIDPLSKRLVVISLRPGVERLPSLGIYEFDEDWNLHQAQMHHIPGLNFAHDFLLLPDYYLFHMTPFVKISKWQTFLIITGITSPRETMKFYSDLPSRFVIIPRDPKKKDNIIQIETDPFHIFHFGTAEQRGEDILFNAVCLGTKFDMTFHERIWLSNASVAPGHLYGFQLDLRKKICLSNQLDSASVEFPTTHPYRHGMTGTRFAYLMGNDRGQCLPFQDVIKVDVKSGKRQVWYSDGIIGEPVFVPRCGYESVTEGDEDDGYVLVQMFHPKVMKTCFCVLDAKNVDQGPIAKIKLKHHVPYGFHGTFCPKVFEFPHSIHLHSKL